MEGHLFGKLELFGRVLEPAVEQAPEFRAHLPCQPIDGAKNGKALRHGRLQAIVDDPWVGLRLQYPGPPPAIVRDWEGEADCTTVQFEAVSHGVHICYYIC